MKQGNKMFSTSNFKQILCPNDTKCKRPYCWFGHSSKLSTRTKGPNVRLSVHSKIAWKIRQLWTTRFYEKLLVLEDPQAAEVALKLEEDIHLRSEKATYTSMALSRLNQIGVIPKVMPLDIKKLKSLTLNSVDLVEMKYPIFPISETAIQVYNVDRTCVRCQKSFKVISDLTEEDKKACQYHSGKLRTLKNHGSKERFFWCCDKPLNSEGCSIGSHVYQFDSYEEMNAVIQFKEAPEYVKDAYKLLALDCEMIYSAGGFELARCTIVDDSKLVIFDELIQPFYTVYDLNTKYSGISEIVNAMSFDNFHAKLFTLMDKSTILVGHSLESDLKAMRLVHLNVIDTVKLYPHVKRLPFRYSLRYLASTYLEEIIQNSNEGHDSKEDAIIALELVLRLI